MVPIIIEAHKVAASSERDSGLLKWRIWSWFQTMCYSTMIFRFSNFRNREEEREHISISSSLHNGRNAEASWWMNVISQDL